MNPNLIHLLSLFYDLSSFVPSKRFLARESGDFKNFCNGKITQVGKQVRKTVNFTLFDALLDVFIFSFNSFDLTFIIKFISLQYSFMKCKSMNHGS